MTILFLILLVLCVYYPTWKFGGVIDDFRRRDLVMAKNSILVGVSPLDTFLRRWYGLGTLARRDKDGRYQIDMFSEHVLTTVIHAINTILVYAVFLPFGEMVGLATAVLWSLNPFNGQLSVWMNGRRYAMALMCVLLMMACMVYGGKFGWLGLAFYPLAVLLQPVAVFSPVVYGVLGIPAIVAAVIFGWRRIFKKISERGEAIGSPDLLGYSWKKLIPATKLYGYYVRKMVFPGTVSMSYDFLFYWGLTDEGNRDAYKLDGNFIWGIVCLCGSVAGVYFIFPDASWYWVLMCVSLLPWCGIVVATQLCAERYAAVSNVFAMFFVVLFVTQYCGIYAAHVLIALATYYTVKLNQSLRMYRDMESFWEYNFFQSPVNPKCREFKATYQIKTNDVLGAWETVREGLKNNPKDFKLNLLAANCMNIMADHKGVIMYLKKAKENCYIGKEFILKDFYKGIFKMDLELEMSKINDKTSPLPREQRENVKRIYDCVMA